MINEVLEKAARISSAAEVLEVDSREIPVEFENNKLKSALSRSSKGYALRIIKDGKIGFSSTTRQDAADDLVQHAVETAEFGQEAVFEFPGKVSSELPDVKVVDKRVADLTVERLVEMGQEVLDAVESKESDAQIAAWASKGWGFRRLVNTRGLDVAFEQTDFSIGASLEIVNGTDMLQVFEHVQSCDLADYRQVIDSIIHKVELGRDTVAIDTRTMPVIFTPKGFASTLSLPLMIGLNGKEALQGATPISDKLGGLAFDERITICDDGTIDFAIGSQLYDGEGLPVRRTPLVEKGVIRSFIYDLESAAKAGKSSTANGNRGLSSLPSPSYNSVVFEPGDASLADMIKGVKYGLLIDQTLGAWAGNVRGGQASGNVHYGIKIENGELVGRVKDVMIACNVFDALRNVETIENKCHWEGNLLAPHILFSGLSVASQE